MTNIFDQAAKADKNDPVTGVVPDKHSMEVNPHVTGTEARVKEVTQELLRYGYIEEARKPALFRTAVTEETKLTLALEPLDLALKLDTFRGVAFLAVSDARTDDTAEDNGWSHPLVRKQRLTLEQSLLIALLRQAFVMHEQESGVGHSAAKVAVDDLLPQYLTYIQDSGSDAKNESRLLSLLDQLKTYAIVSEVDKNQEVTIRPMIAHLANPESLAALLQSLSAVASGSPAEDGEGPHD